MYVHVCVYVHICVAGWHQRGGLLLCAGVTHKHMYHTYIHPYVGTYIHPYVGHFSVFMYMYIFFCSFCPPPIFLKIWRMKTVLITYRTTWIS